MTVSDNGMNAGGGDTWSLAIRPRPFPVLVAVACAWGIVALVAGLAAIGGDTGVAVWISTVPFALVVTWYGLRTVSRDRGVLVVDREGFLLGSGSGQPDHYAWADIEGFYLTRFGDTPVAPGITAPHFRLRGSGIEYDLPQTLGYPPARMVELMNALLALHASGWPRFPKTWGDILEADPA